MLEEICGELRNYFRKEAREGSFVIKDGIISPFDFIQNGQYFRIVGSVFNDGVHQFPNDALIDENFVGSVWALAIPPTLIALADEIKAYAESDAAKPSPYTSESFGGYSYSKSSEDASSWQKVFAKRLNRWRKI